LLIEVWREEGLRTQASLHLRSHPASLQPAAVFLARSESREHAGHDDRARIGATAASGDAAGSTRSHSRGHWSPAASPGRWA